MTEWLQYSKKAAIPVSVHHFVDPSHSVVISTCSGEVTFQDILASVAELRDDPKFEPGFRQLGDLSHISGVKFGISELQEIYRAHDPFSNEGRRAMVTAGVGHAHDLVCAYQMLVSRSRFGIFRSMEEAVSWLDLSITIIEPSAAENPDPQTRLHDEEPLILDLPPDVPRSFRGFRDAARAIAAKR